MNATIYAEKLASYMTRIDEMLDLLNDMKINKDTLQKLMSEIKHDFKKDKEVWDSARKIDKATDIEYTYYDAVVSALCEINVKSKSIPSSDWVDELLSARDKLDV
ncbi:hypothetical protein D3C73_1508240 [compost metagenome]